jgi:cell division protein FtsW (lipid II flippase)
MGGSALIMTCVAIGIVQSIASRLDMQSENEVVTENDLVVA